MHCEFQHILGMTAQEASNAIRYISATRRFPGPVVLRKFLAHATAEDYLVINLGHHIEPIVIGDAWKQKYQQEIFRALTANFGNIPRNHVFFRTTDTIGVGMVTAILPLPRWEAALPI